MIEIYNPDDPEPEPLDLVNEYDEVVGRTHQSLVYEEFNHVLAGYFARQADVFLQNDAGQLFTPIRQPHKMLAPNGLDFAAAEHVQASETYLDAAVRGVYEELNMVIHSSDLTHIGKLTPWATHTLYFSEVYLLRHNATPNYNRKDYSGFLWLKPGNLSHLLHLGAQAKKTLEPGLNLLLEYGAERQRDKQRDNQIVQSTNG